MVLVCMPPFVSPPRVATLPLSAIKMPIHKVKQNAERFLAEIVCGQHVERGNVTHMTGSPARRTEIRGRRLGCAWCTL